jgi:hypothetical protein
MMYLNPIASWSDRFRTTPIPLTTRFDSGSWYYAAVAQFGRRHQIEGLDSVDSNSTGGISISSPMEEATGLSPVKSRFKSEGMDRKEATCRSLF